MVLLHVSRYFKQKKSFFFHQTDNFSGHLTVLGEKCSRARTLNQVKSLLGALFSKLPSTWAKDLEQLENYLLNDRGIRTAFSDPEVTSAIQEVASNPLTVVKCFSNPSLLPFFRTYCFISTFRALSLNFLCLFCR